MRNTALPPASSRSGPTHLDDSTVHHVCNQMWPQGERRAGASAAGGADVFLAHPAAAPHWAAMSSARRRQPDSTQRCSHTPHKHAAAFLPCINSARLPANRLLQGLRVNWSTPLDCCERVCKA